MEEQVSDEDPCHDRRRVRDEPASHRMPRLPNRYGAKVQRDDVERRVGGALERARESADELEASPTVGRVRGAHRDHLHVESAHPIRAPRLAHRVPFQEPEQAKALEAAELEAGGTRPGASLPRHKHVRTQRFVA